MSVERGTTLGINPGTPEHMRMDGIEVFVSLADMCLKYVPPLIAVTPVVSVQMDALEDEAV